MWRDFHLLSEPPSGWVLWAPRHVAIAIGLDGALPTTLLHDRTAELPPKGVPIRFHSRAREFCKQVNKLLKSIKFSLSNL